MDWTLEVVILPVSDLTSAIESYRDKVGGDKVCGDKPLIPLDHRGRFGDDA